MSIHIFKSMDVEICVRREWKNDFLINHQEEDMVVHLDKNKYWDILNENSEEYVKVRGL